MAGSRSSLATCKDHVPPTAYPFIVRVPRGGGEEYASAKQPVLHWNRWSLQAQINGSSSLDSAAFKLWLSSRSEASSCSRE